MNVEADALVGPMLTRLAREAGVVYSVEAGDEPGVLGDMVDWVRTIGLEVVAALKGCMRPIDWNANAQTLAGEAARLGLNPKMLASFRDGSKHCVEICVTAKGRVVNISSMAGVCGEAAHAIYCAFKGALNALTKSLAIDYGRDGIRCNAVCPSSVLTPATDAIIRTQPNPKAVIEYRQRVNHLGYTATPDEIAAVVVFLASPEASFITGAIVPVSGGSECGYGIK